MNPRFGFWLQWVLANSLAETIGLGGAFLAGYAVVVRVGPPGSGLASLAYAGLALVLGTLEGALVGLAQWWVLRHRLPSLRRFDWMLATAAGALAAWFLGVLPSTTMDLAQSSPPAQSPEVPDWLVYLLAAGMGALLGPILASFQWLALRRHLDRAWRWIPANAAAWIVGLPLTFAAAGAIQWQTAPVLIGLSLLLTIALAGAVVGAIHGFALTRMLFHEGEVHFGASAGEGQTLMRDSR